MSDLISKLKEKIQKLGLNKAFDVNDIEYINSDEIGLPLYNNWLMVSPQNAQVERQLKANPYHHKITTSKNIHFLFYFPNPVIDINTCDCPKLYINEELPQNYKEKLQYLLDSNNKGQIIIYTGLKFSCLDDINSLQYHHKPYNKDNKDNKPVKADTSLIKLPTLQEQTFKEIRRVNLNYSTVLILDNAKLKKNNSLSRYKNNVNTFYSDIIVNYLLEHSGLLNPINFRYQTNYEIHIQVKELTKLYPHNHFKLQLPNGVNLTYQSKRRTNTKTTRISKNDTAIFTFTDDFMATYKAIITQEPNNINSFIKFPVGFLLQALKQENLTPNGFNFLLWLLPTYRMQTPRITHSIKTILKEIGADLKHGYNKPLQTLTNYIHYLQSCNMFIDCPMPIILNKKSIDEPLKYNGHLLQLCKPKK